MQDGPGPLALEWAATAQEMQWVQGLDKGPLLQLHMVPGTAIPLDSRQQREVQVRTDKLGVVAFYKLQTKDTCSQQPGRSSRSCYQFSLPTTSLSRHMAACTALVCSMPVRLCHRQSETSNVWSEMTGQWSDSRKTLSQPDQMSYLRGLALKIWTPFWRKEGSTDMAVAPIPAC